MVYCNCRFIAMQIIVINDYHFMTLIDRNLLLVLEIVGNLNRIASTYISSVMQLVNETYSFLFSLHGHASFFPIHNCGKFKV